MFRELYFNKSEGVPTDQHVLEYLWPGDFIKPKHGMMEPSFATRYYKIVKRRLDNNESLDELKADMKAMAREAAEKPLRLPYIENMLTFDLD